MFVNTIKLVYCGHIVKRASVNIDSESVKPKQNSNEKKLSRKFKADTAH